ncbi:hypothetical protein [Noviherbaspirillum sp. Root189]|uniref:hypothetical protein n=1 Tax=Noviherbaspirillum sp. Root189 TaxID=1736487 RepID=UPI00070DBD93|nr:hypothetical protein [Noviherbaspirillum sp. Root189]KRB79172.1 hypothetical protein ASE07_05725 [Noviherbaspirillum sp. Root189]
MDSVEDNKAQEPAARPWIVLTTTYDVEAWIDNYNWELQRAIEKKNTQGHGICFGLEHGGEVYLHTTQDGDVVLDVTPEAEWVAPLISAAAQVAQPAGQIWALPGDALTQLILGLSPLIATTRIVVNHDFKIRKKW